MKTSRMPTSICPICKSSLEAATSLKNEIPDPGDISVCLYCGNILKFNDDLELVSLSNDEMQALKNSKPDWDEIVKIQSLLFLT